MNKTLTFAAAVAASSATLALSGASMAQDLPQRGTEMTRADAEARAAAHFARMDANDDGVLDEADREARARARFERMDTNNDGMLSFAETQAARDTMQERRAERRAEAGEREGRRGQRMARRGGGMRGMMMNRADTDNDGSITEAEFTNAALARFERADANSDGTVTSEERRQQMRERRAERRQNRG